jgi:prepilin-type N-terminal cleavage/methylation domain-containing protein
MIQQKQKAFTLVELIIVISILAVLATISFMSFSSYVSKSRDAQRLSTLTNLEKGLVSSQVTVGKLPIPDNAITVSSSGEVLLHEGIF